MPRPLKLLVPALAFAAPALWAAQAHAGLGACGNIHVEAEARCEVLAGVECEAACEPISFEAECAGELYVECDLPDECSFEVSAECSGSCEADCNTRCEANPATFDCKADCFAKAEAEAEARCGTDSECFASAEATFEAECSASCEIDPGEIECEGECAASCEGSCSAEANVQCQIECQRDGYLDCKGDLEGGCKLDCDAEGALFCDSQYVDHGGNLEECVDSLRALLDIEVEGYARGSCGNGKCSGEAGGSISCAVAPERSTGALWLAMGLGLFGVASYRRRR